jgi:hypothetical protein
LCATLGRLPINDSSDQATQNSIDVATIVPIEKQLAALLVEIEKTEERLACLLNSSKDSDS